MSVGLAHPETANGRPSNLVQCRDVADGGLTKLFEHFVVILPESARQSAGSRVMGSGNTHADVVIDCIIGEVWSFPMAAVEIGFLVDRPAVRHENDL